MKKIITLTLFIILTLTLSGCKLIDFFTEAPEMTREEKQEIRVNNLKDKVNYSLGQTQKESPTSYKVPLYLNTNTQILGFSGTLRTNKCDNIILPGNSASLIAAKNNEGEQFKFSVASPSPFKVTSTEPVLFFSCSIETVELENIDILFDSYDEISL